MSIHEPILKMGTILAANQEMDTCFAMTVSVVTCMVEMSPPRAVVLGGTFYACVKVGGREDLKTSWDPVNILGLNRPDWLYPT